METRAGCGPRFVLRGRFPDLCHQAAEQGPNLFRADLIGLLQLVAANAQVRQLLDQLGWSVLGQILSVSVFEKTEVSCALQPDRSQPEPPTAAYQLILFDFLPNTTESARWLNIESAPPDNGLGALREWHLLEAPTSI